MCRTDRQRRGAMLGILAFLMAAFMLTAALAIEIAQVHLARTELRTATDAAAEAVAESLYRGMDPLQARQQGIDIAAQNKVMGRPLTLAERNFQFGSSAEKNKTGRLIFSADRFPLNSVRVTSVRPATAPEGAVRLFLGKILGKDFIEIRASATATYVEQDVVLTSSTTVTQ